MTSGPTLRTVRLFGIDLHAVTQSDAVAAILDWVVRREGMHFVVTPNVQHAVLYQENAELRRAYAAASLVIVDGWPLRVRAERAPSLGFEGDKHIDELVQGFIEDDLPEQKQMVAAGR